MSMKGVALAAALICAAAPEAPAAAQEGAGEGAAKAGAATPNTDAEWMAWVPASGEIEMPNLAFEERPSDVKDYKKYYFFNRPDTSFETALADIRECDGLARGLYRGDYSADYNTTMMYGIGGAIGGALGSALADAIYGSAEERRKRRVNMRRCMFFKGCERYGLPKKLWEEFNFEEGNRTVPEEERQRLLAQQAKAASGPRPAAEGQGL